MMLYLRDVPFSRYCIGFSGVANGSLVAVFMGRFDSLIKGCHIVTSQKLSHVVQPGDRIVTCDALRDSQQLTPLIG